jgi:UPF0755 protein
MSEPRREPRRQTQTVSGLRPRSPAEALEPARAPTRPKNARIRRERRVLGAVVRVISGILTTLLVMMGVFGGLGFLVYNQFERPGPLALTRTVAIPKGEGRIEVAARLEREGVIANRWAFVAAHLMQGLNGQRKSYDIKAGEYEIRKGASMQQVLQTLMDGKSVLSKLTVPEGLTSHQIVERVKADHDLTGDLTVVPPEGSLMPETYRFSKGMARTDIVERMQMAQQKLLATLWEKRQAGLPFETVEQALVMASIVEKETGRSDERDRVAAVFINRLRKNMPLQSDPTILYGLYGGTVQWGKPILRSEIDSKTPHNTYQVRGLPPTPICNPGRSAIEATLNPAKTADLYFVADGQGGHTFSENLKDHNAAVQAWRKHEKEVKAARREAAQSAGPGIAAEPDPEQPAAAEQPPPQAAPAARPATAATTQRQQKPKKP